MRARQFVLRTHYSMYRRCPQRWRIATVATDTPPNLLPVQGLYSVSGREWMPQRMPYLTILIQTIGTVECPVSRHPRDVGGFPLGHIRHFHG